MSAPFDRSKALFLAAVDLHGAARDAFLAEACGGDADLQREVASLLAFHDDEAAALEPEPQSFHAGALFANRYRMIARLGRGGMGDVWRADDLVLETAVALKLIHATGLDARRRVLNEVRLARQITHAAVCRVFDVGESDGHSFFTMELVEGEDLASVLRRAGRLSSDTVVDIGIQLCAGLGAAHAQGVLHRDLKPANVLVDDRGRIRITDFGIAVMRAASGHHTRIGTPGYMAPEQLTSGGTISEQTDVYALGLILYELVAGCHPFDPLEQTGPPPAPSTLAADVHPALERVILDALAVEPRARPSSAASMEDRLQAIRASQTAVPRRALTSATPARRWLAGAAGVVILLLLTLAGFAVLQRRATTLTARDTIILTDFANSTSDPVFDGALKVALAVALEQSPFLKVFPDERVRDTLRLMKRPVDAGITRTVAREVAQRERLTALIAGSIDSLGRHYLISLEAIDADSGEVMAREQAEVEEKEQVLSALGRVSSTLRQKLGESVSSTQKFDAALPRATTPSLEALQAYSLALEGGRWMTVKREGIPHLMHAIELDPEFALAQAALSGVYANTGQSGLAPDFARRAFELRDRVSERERFFISWRYYRDATQAQDKALELARTWTVTYPREMFAFNSFGLASSTLGRHEQAIEPFRRAMALDPTYFAPYDNLAAMMLTLGRFDDAQAVLQEAANHQVDFISLRRTAYLLAFRQHDEGAMARHLEVAETSPQAMTASDWRPRTLAFDGHVRDAHEGFRQGAQSAQRAGFPQRASRLLLENAELSALTGECGEATGDAGAALASSRDNDTLERASRVFGLCGADADVTSLSKELTRRFPDATLTMYASLPVAAAALAVHRNEPERTIALLEPVRPYDHVSEFWPAYLRGTAYLQLRDGRKAAEAFQSIIDHRGESMDSILFPLGHLGRARAAVMTGDVTAARVAYQAVVDLWRTADVDLRPLQDAQREQRSLPQQP